jgi:hypothetical protein
MRVEVAHYASMPTELPIACSLSASDLSQRLAEMADLGRSALIDAEHAGTYATLRFRTGEDTRERLAAIVAAEARCCAFLQVAVHDEDDRLVLAISAPPDASLVLDELVTAFAGAPS